jgi:chromosome segregation ATPase
MTLDQILNNLEDQIYGLGRSFFPADPAIQMQEQIDQLSEDLQQRNLQLSQNEEAIRELKERLAQIETQAALHASRVETYMHVNDRGNAWQHALELDQLRYNIEQDRTRLTHLEIARRRQYNHIRQLERSLATLQEKFYT